LATIIAPEISATSEGGASDLPRVLVGLLGVYLLVPAIPTTISTIIAVVSARMAQGSWAAGFEITRFIDLGIRIAISLYLIMRPERLVDFLRRPRAEQAG
jgi:hypothetical protein